MRNALRKSLPPAVLSALAACSSSAGGERAALGEAAAPPRPGPLAARTELDRAAPADFETATFALG
jgi:hypothetical protein